MRDICAVQPISSSIAPYETAHFIDKTILSYHLKGIAFDYSPFPFYEKKLSNNQQTMETHLQNVIAGKAQSKTRKLLYLKLRKKQLSRYPHFSVIQRQKTA